MNRQLLIVLCCLITLHAPAMNNQRFEPTYLAVLHRALQGVSPEDTPLITKMIYDFFIHCPAIIQTSTKQRPLTMRNTALIPPVPVPISPPAHFESPLNKQSEKAAYILSSITTFQIPQPPIQDEQEQVTLPPIVHETTTTTKNRLPSLKFHPTGSCYTKRIPNPETGHYPCRFVCGKELKNSKSIVNHEAKCPNNPKNKIVTHTSPTPVNTLSMMNPPSQPLTKNYSFTSHSSNRKTRPWKRYTPISCSYCNKDAFLFTTNFLLQKHMRDVHDKIRYLCEECRKVFSRKSFLQTHHQKEHSHKDMH